MRKIIVRTMFALSVILNFGLTMAFTQRNMLFHRESEERSRLVEEKWAYQDKLRAATALAADQARERTVDVDVFECRLKDVAKQAKQVVDAAKLAAYNAEQAARNALQVLAEVDKINTAVATVRNRIKQGQSPAELAAR